MFNLITPRFESKPWNSSSFPLSFFLSLSLPNHFFLSLLPIVLVFWFCENCSWYIERREREEEESWVQDQIVSNSIGGFGRERRADSLTHVLSSPLSLSPILAFRSLLSLHCLEISLFSLSLLSISWSTILCYYYPGMIRSIGSYYFNVSLCFIQEGDISSEKVRFFFKHWFIFRA